MENFENNLVVNNNELFTKKMKTISKISNRVYIFHIVIVLLVLIFAFFDKQ